MKFPIKAIAIAVLMAPAFIFAQDAAPAAPAATSTPAAAPAPATITDDAAAQINKAVSTHQKVSPQSRVDKDIDAYCKEAGITIGAVTDKDAIYLKGIQKVKANVKSPNFVRSRTMAYEKAYQEAVASYVMDKFGKEAVEQFNTHFSDMSSNRLQPSAGDSKSVVERIAEKTQQLTEAKLDEGLRAMGVAPAGTLAQKRKLAEDSIVKNSMRDAVGSAAGLLPVQTFEGWDGNDEGTGNYAVGVVIRGGAETEVIADCLRSKARPHLVRPEAGITVAEALPSDDELVSQFGVRLFFDKKGVPALLSFAQWGSAYTGNDEDMADEALKHAMRQAEALANEQLTTFINSTITVRETSEKSEEMNDDVLFDANGNLSEEKTKVYIDRTMNSSVIRGSDTMIGRSTVAKKVIVHPANGHKLAVCVRMWSFGQYDAMKRIIEKPKPAAPVVTPAAPVPTDGTPGKRRGRSYDF